MEEKLFNLQEGHMVSALLQVYVDKSRPPCQEVNVRYKEVITIIIVY